MKCGKYENTETVMSFVLENIFKKLSVIGFNLW